MKRILSVVAVPVFFCACGVGDVGSTGAEREGLDESQQQLVVRSCFEAVLAGIDPATGTLVDGGAIDPHQLAQELAACLRAHGLPSFDAGLPPFPVFDAGLPPLPPFPSFDAGRPPLPPGFDAGLPPPPPPPFDGGLPPLPPVFDAGLPPLPPAFDAGLPPRPSFDAGLPAGIGSACSANCTCPQGLRCMNPLQSTCPTAYARCMP